MRGIATVIVVGFVSIILFGIVAPAVLEPVAAFVVENAPANAVGMDVSGYTDRMLTALLVYAPLFVIGSGVVSAVVWYMRRERVVQRR